jgi:hypothetical protein
MALHLVLRNSALRSFAQSKVSVTRSVQDFYDTVTKPGERPFAGAFSRIVSLHDFFTIFSTPPVDCMVGVESHGTHAILSKLV